MKLTDTQFKWLQWMDRHGGVAFPVKQWVAAPDGDHTNTGAPISFLNLVAKGAIEGRDGKLILTDYGRRLLNPFGQRGESQPGEDRG